MLVSSHLLSEVAQSVDEVVVISHGVMRASGTLASVLGSPDGPVTRVRAAHDDQLLSALQAPGLTTETDGANTLIVRGSSPEVVGEVANEHRIALTELVAVSRSLEDAFFDITGGERMRVLLQAELIKLRTTRTFVALASVAMGISLILTILTWRCSPSRLRRTC